MSVSRRSHATFTTSLVGALLLGTVGSAVPAAAAETWTWQEDFDVAAQVDPNPADAPATDGVPTFDEVYGRWGTYNSTTPNDTSTRGTYDTDRTTSVANGALQQRLHHANGRHHVSAVLAPVAGGTDPWSGRLYGTYEVRLRVTDPSASYKVAYLHWPSSDDWAQGEIDWVEADDLARTARPRPASKQLGNHAAVFQPSPLRYAAAAIADGQYHTYRTEWTATALRFHQDGVLVASVTNPAFIPKVPMRWVFQAETIVAGALSTTDPAVVQVDWARYRAA